MTKYICIKDCEVSGMNIRDVKVGDKVSIFEADFAGLEEPESEVIMIGNEIYLIAYKEFPNHFIPLAEWREQQINEILN